MRIKISQNYFVYDWYKVTLPNLELTVNMYVVKFTYCQLNNDRIYIQDWFNFLILKCDLTELLM